MTKSGLKAISVNELIRIESGLVGVHTRGESGRIQTESRLEPLCKLGYSVVCWN